MPAISTAVRPLDLPASPLLHGEDPFGLVPASLLPGPRVLCTKADLERVRSWMNEHAWVAKSIDRLLANVRKAEGVPDRGALPADAKQRGAINVHCERLALAHAITGDDEFLGRAVDGVSSLVAWAKSPAGPTANLFGGGLAESHGLVHLSRTVDLLVSAGVPVQVIAEFQELLRSRLPGRDAEGHRTCGNHNTWLQASRFAIGAALGDRRVLLDALYGNAAPASKDPDVPSYRYGIVHFFRHDFLSDGLHWERTVGYHYYTLMAITEILLIAGNLGIDLWNARLPALTESDGADLHRGYGPVGDKCIRSAYETPLYAAFANGDLSLTHDTGLENLRGIWIWGTLYDAAYDAYRDDRFAWLLDYMEREHPDEKREHPGLPMGLQTRHGDVDFVRVRHASVPRGTHPFSRDTLISFNGRYTRGCTHLPGKGEAVLRADPFDANSPGIGVFYGPHSAGHQSPCSLHLDIHALGRMVAVAPVCGGYDDPNYLHWYRATIAHNTVAVDESSMFPYDFETQSIWEADAWRRRVSDGDLQLLQVEEGFRAVRVSNQNVYQGVKLDRTTVLTRDYVLDAYRVFADTPRQYDWAMHVAGRVEVAGESSPFDPGERRGYRYFKNVRRHELVSGRVSAAWRDDVGVTRAEVLAAGATFAFTGDDPIESDHPNLGAKRPPQRRSVLVMRAHASRLVFISLWSFASLSGEARAAVLGDVAGDADHDLRVPVTSLGRTKLWRVPVQSRRVCVD